jgi:hypothetical protein
MKALVIASLLAAVSSPALANVSGQPVAPSPAPAPLTLQLEVSHGSARHTYQVRLADSCGGFEDNSPDWQTRVRVCAHPTANGFRLKLDGRLHVGNVEYRTDFESTIQRGARIDVGRDGGVRFAVHAT